MNINFEIYLAIIVIICYFDVLLVLKILIDRSRHASHQDRLQDENRGILKILTGSEHQDRQNDLTESYLRMRQSVSLDQDHLGEITARVQMAAGEPRVIRRLHSVWKVRRMEAAVQLGNIGSDEALAALEAALVPEKYFPVKLYIANAIADFGTPRSIPVLVESLLNTHRWYRVRVNALIAGYGADFRAYLPQLLNRGEAEIKDLILDFASVDYSSQLHDYLLKMVSDKDLFRHKALYEKMDKIGNCCGNCCYGRQSDQFGRRLCPYKGTVSPLASCRRFRRLPVSIEGGQYRQNQRYRAAEILAAFYPRDLSQVSYLYSADPTIRKIAVKALANFHTRDNLDILLRLLRDTVVAPTAVDAISELTSRNPRQLGVIEAAFRLEKDAAVKKLLAEILARKIEYYMARLLTVGVSVAEIIRQVLLMGRTSSVIDFLNKNNNEALETAILEILAAVIGSEPAVEADVRAYLHPDILQKMNLLPAEEPAAARPPARDRHLIRGVYLVMLFVAVLFPAIYLARHWPVVRILPVLSQLRLYIIDFNQYLIFYALAVNCIYLVLMALSLVNLKTQERLWRLKTTAFLFKRNMLPSISIIAPAFNEEKNIVESVISLLNLKYPDYELVVVNDGSRDRTLEVLIQAFDLQRIDYQAAGRLNTLPIRGVYRNESLPRLVVVDKVNGGKADALNVGINLAGKEFFCGIDADSLLEGDALLKLASLEIDAGVEMPALGGNVFPANGCLIDKGTIKEVRIPRQALARFQTIEYIRAFMSGRLGWSQVNALLIISGAFGLFRRERVIRVGGYMTSSGPYEKDTVGEDMELVVRINRLMREQKLTFKIGYAFNANCWTEVPEDMASLRRQRFRWQRGLTDILVFHRKLLFNPAYGRIGLVAMPYYFLFELIGPFIEFQGYLMVVLAALLGLLNVEIAALLFIATVLLGTLISLFALMINEHDTPYLRLRDTWTLILYALTENFGPRQAMSFWRVFGSFRIVYKREGWGRIKRKGFRT